MPKSKPFTFEFINDLDDPHVYIVQTDDGENNTVVLVGEREIKQLAEKLAEVMLVFVAQRQAVAVGPCTCVMCPSCMAKKLAPPH